MKKIITTISIIIIFINVFSLRVGIYENTPYVKNIEEGIVVELLKYIENNYNINIDLVIGTQPEMISKLKTGKIDAVTPLGETKKRKQFGIFNKNYFFTEWGIAYANENSNVSTFQQLENKNIAVMDTDIYYEGEYGLKNILSNFAINVNFVEYDSYKKVLESVENGLNDIAVVNRLYDIKDYENLKRTNILFSPVFFKILFRKDLSDIDSIVSTFDNALNDLINDKDSIYYDILDKYTVSQQTVLPDNLIRNIIIALSLILAIILVLYFLIVYMRRTIKYKTEEAENLSGKLFQMINLVSKIGSEEIDIDEFYDDLLNGTLNIIDEAETGSISLYDHDKWTYLTAYGHDKDKIMKMNLKKEYRLPVEDTEIFTLDQVVKMDKKIMPESIKNKFEKYTSPFKQMMVSRVTINENTSMDFSIEIPEDSDKVFTEESKIIFKSLVSLSKTFMSNKINFNTVRNAYVNFA
ncbi:MAG: substrate-binding periplasmic protein, partial [Thermotogota bacterium]